MKRQCLHCFLNNRCLENITADLVTIDNHFIKKKDISNAFCQILFPTDGDLKLYITDI